MSKFGHEESYRGAESLSLLATRKVTICGVGALGSNLADMLCRQGVESLRVLDFDRVEESNVGAQLYGDGDVGSLKVKALADRIFRDVGVEVEVVAKKLEPNNVAKLLGASDLIVDCFDNHEARRLLKRHGDKNGVDVLHVGLGDGYFEVIHNKNYSVPMDHDGRNPCEYPMARNLVMIAVSVAAEEVVRFLTGFPKREFFFTLGDMFLKKIE